MMKRYRPVLWSLALFAVLLLAVAGCAKPADQPLEVTGAFPAAGATGVPQDAAVEFTFTTAPGELDDYLTIQPEIKGRFQYMGNVVAFIPDGSAAWDEELPGRWLSETTYTVTLKAGLPAREGKGTLAEDYVFSFTAQKEDALLFQTRHFYETFLPGDYPVLDLERRSYRGEEKPPAEGGFQVSVYPLESGERYRDELYKAATYGGFPKVDTTGMTPVLTFTQGVEELTAVAEDDRILDIIFPETLAEGWYVATIIPDWNSGLAVQKLLQVQPSAVYTQVQNGEALVWFNSTADGKPVAGATMEIIADPFASGEAAFSATAGEDGIVTVDYSVLGKDPDSWPATWGGRSPFLLYSLTAPEGTVYYDVIRSYHDLGRSETVWQQYYGFLYTDRPIYYPSDTIKFWGVARARKDVPPLSAVTVELSHYGSEAVETLELPVSPDGIFTGEISYTGFASGELSLHIYPAGEGRDPDQTGSGHAICSEYLGIAQYKKPIYTASIDADKLYYRLGETVNAQVEVSLFDRTPAAGMKMLLSTGDPYQEREKREFTTGEDGVIHTSYPAELEEDPTAGWYPRPFYLHAANGDASDVDLSVSQTVFVFPTSIMLEVEEEHDKETGTLSIRTDNIDFDKIPSGGQVIQEYKTLRGTPAQAEVQVGIRKVSYTRVELPPYYDRYQKRSVPRYTYQRQEEYVDHITRTTGPDGVLVLEDLPVSGELATYYAEVDLYQGGQQQRTTVLLGERWNCVPEERNAHFHTFQVTTSLTEDGYSSYWGYFAFGDEARYQVADNGIPVEEGTALTNLVQNTILGKASLGGTSGTFLCGEDTLPDFTLCGAYFDGVRIYPIQPVSMQVDPQSRSLSLQILPEEEDYRPGDTARVTLRLTGEDGKPVNGGNVCLGVVDEAIFAVREQYLNMGNTLYREVYYSFPEVSASYVQHGEDLYYGEGGKGGGGGGDGVTVRDNFQDTAGFLTARTGPDGTASFRVPLPDDLTQWRLTAVALDSRAYWGQAKSQLYTTLPFRIDPILSTTFLSGDTIACTVRGFGTAISTGDQVTYTAAIHGYSEPLEVTATAPAGQITPLVFQKLPAGDYTMTVTARCGEHSDGIKKSFTVRDSALTFPIHRTVDLREGMGDIRPTLWPVEISVYHEGQKPFMQAWSLLESDRSLRGDAQLAMESVRQTMTDFFGEDYRHPDTDTSGIQIDWWDEEGEVQGGGGLRLYPYGEADIPFSAMAAVAVPELVEDRYSLGSFLSQAYTEAAGDTDRAAALMGLAALDQLSDDQRVLLQTRAQNSSLPVRESAYLIAGLSYLDQAAAQKLYSQQIAPQLREERGGLYLPANTAYDTVDQTAGALTCAILTGAADDAQGMLEYLAQNAVTRYGTLRGPCQLEAALYLHRFQPKESQLPTVSYTRDGERKEMTLSLNGGLRMTLTKEEFQALDMKAEGGPAIASVSYTGDPDQLDFTQSPRVTVTKTMDTLEEQKHLGGETTVTIRVELDPAMPYGQYQLVEWVPSNMRLREVLRKDENGKRYQVPFNYRLDEQLLTVDFYHNRRDGNIFTLRYTATSVLDTECTLERSYAYCAETMEGGRTEKGEFLPSDYYYLGVGYLFRKE